jgi:hypothetical protein
MHHRFVQRIEIKISNKEEKGENLLLNTPDSIHNQKARTSVIQRERKRMRKVEDHLKFFMNLENIKARCFDHGKPLVARRGKSHE